MCKCFACQDMNGFVNWYVRKKRGDQDVILVDRRLLDFVSKLKIIVDCAFISRERL